MVTLDAFPAPFPFILQISSSRGSALRFSGFLIDLSEYFNSVVAGTSFITMPDVAPKEKPLNEYVLPEYSSPSSEYMDFLTERALVFPVSS